MGSTEIVRYQGGELAVAGPMSIEEITGQKRLIQEAMKAVMKDGEHYGVIPGTNKPTLYKAGAETILVLFRLAPYYDVQLTEMAGGHIGVLVTCSLHHILSASADNPRGNMVGQGVGMCSTKETRYAYRTARAVCPNCHRETVIKGKAEYGGGWLCFKKTGGCGHKWPDGAPEIESQPTGRIDNPDLADAYNTVVKMGCKRALVAATLNVTAASDIFTQDIEDLPEFAPAAKGGAEGNAAGGADGGRTEADRAAPPPSDEPVEAEQGGRPRIGSRADLIGRLQRGLGLLEGKPGWTLAEVLVNASAKWQREIGTLEDLKVEEMKAILEGMLTHGGVNA